MKHVVSMREATPPNCGDEATERALAEELQAMRAKMPTGVRYVVAAGKELRTHDGRVLRAGEAVEPRRDFSLEPERRVYDVINDMMFTHSARPVHQQVRDAVDRGVIVESDRIFDDSPSAA